MARARLLKPGFFTNDNLAELPMSTRLLFAGLWTIADREGRLEDRPKRIKAELLPYDDVDVDAALDMLDQWGFIQRYAVGGNYYIQIPSFSKHQSPHMREPASTIPAPDEHSASPSGQMDEHQSSPAVSGDPVSGDPVSGGACGDRAMSLEAPSGAPRTGKVTEDFLDEMQQKYPRLDVRECWEEARNHKAIDKRKDHRRYLQTWLRKETQGGHGPPPANGNGKTSMEFPMPENMDCEFCNAGPMVACETHGKPAREPLTRRA